jgi:hypothetical protein
VSHMTRNHCHVTTRDFRYGSHPIYLEHRYNATTGKASSSGVLLLGCVTGHLTAIVSFDNIPQCCGFRYLPANACGIQSIIDRVPVDWWYPGLLLLFRPHGCRSHCPVWLDHRVPHVAASVGFRVPSLQVIFSAIRLT